jgi:hypothetical protein
MSNRTKIPSYNPGLLLEEELIKLLDLEINILKQRFMESSWQLNIKNLQDALSKLGKLKKMVLNSSSIILFQDFQEYINFMIETIELSLSENDNIFNLLKYVS